MYRRAGAYRSDGDSRRRVDRSDWSVCPTTIPSGAQEVRNLTGHPSLQGLSACTRHTSFGGSARAVQMNVSGPLLYLSTA